MSTVTTIKQYCSNTSHQVITVLAVALLAILLLAHEAFVADQLRLTYKLLQGLNHISLEE